MSAAEKIPFEEMALNADEVGMLFGLKGRTVLESLACQPSFPGRLTIRPATWKASEVLEWREQHRVGPPTRSRSQRSTT